MYDHLPKAPYQDVDVEGEIHDSSRAVVKTQSDWELETSPPPTSILLEGTSSNESPDWDALVAEISPEEIMDSFQSTLAVLEDPQLPDFPSDHQIQNMGDIMMTSARITTVLLPQEYDVIMDTTRTTATESLYSPPHDPHLPDDTEAHRTKEVMKIRTTQIERLNKKISDRQENMRKLQEKELGVLRPMLDQLHASICEIQREMARLWTEYTARMSAAQEVAQAEVAGLQERVEFLERENSKSQSFLAPIRRLPTELLAEIFVIAITCHGQNPFDMIRVCRSWRVTIFGMARIWSHLTLRPSTAKEYVEFVVERTKQVSLEVEINSNRTIHSSHRCVGEEKPFRGMDLALKTMSRWRAVNVVAFPGEAEVIKAAEEGESAMTFARPLERLEVLKITGPCEMSPPFSQFLDTVTKTSTEKLTHVEIATPNVIWFLSSPCYRPFFSRLRYFKVDVREMKEPADILPFFENLEELEAYRLHLPVYCHDRDLPLVRTLKRMSIKIVPVQWMSGRTFPLLEECTIVWPHHPETLRLHGGVDLPACTQFTYDDHLIEPMSEFRLPKLHKMVVRNEAWNKPRGSLQLASVWGESMNPKWLRPRVLHLDTQCHDQHLINALQLLPDLEELVLGLVRPDGLGKKFFNSMVARRPKGSAQPNGGSSSQLVAPLLPKLKVFGMRYRRWIREKEKDEITPLLEKIIQSREKTEVPLQSVKFWPTKDTLEEDAKELVPLRICEITKASRVTQHSDPTDLALMNHQGG